MNALSQDGGSPSSPTSPKLRIASPRRLNLEIEDQPLLRSPLTSPRRATTTDGALSVISKRAPLLVSLAMVCFLMTERISLQMGSPCENKVDRDLDLQHANATISNIIGALPHSNLSTTDLEPRSNRSTTELDFAILGFPKTGTTFLIYALEQHPEVVMPPDGTAPYEFCQIHHQKGDKELVAWLRNASSTASQLTKYGIKCPTMIRAVNAIENLMKVSDRTKLIVGVRHPVLWFQSFYNYRVFEKHKNPDNDPDPIPSPFTLTHEKQWRDVSLAYAKFDAYLKQLVKVPLRGNELKDMLHTDNFWEKRIMPNPYKIFIYTSEQLNDKNATRQNIFRTEMQQFLGLESPLVDFNTMPEMNKHDEVYSEYIDICNSTYAPIKKQLLEEGKKSSQWIIEKFIKSNDVIAGNRDYFVERLKGWGADPCKKNDRK